MKAGKYAIKDLFSNRYVQQIIIPEIQRDYVWGELQVKGLMTSILEDYNKYNSGENGIPTIDSEDEDLVRTFKDFYKRRTFSSNIGFIYAYSDDQYPGKYFLIDGQQRITTIYLILLILASKSKKLADNFQATYIHEGIPKLDYKVRESAHLFLSDFVSHTLNKKGDFKNDMRYFENKYRHDQTVQSIINNTQVIEEILGESDLEISDLYFYLEQYVEFWYFDTNISEQGEELYLYMNARGEQMQGNENIKAELLGRLETDELKNEFGSKWENWQDFFWKHRGKNNNADKGFNNFLACISGLELFLKKDESKFYSKKQFDSLGQVLTNDVVTEINLKTIEEYFESLKYLFDQREDFMNIRPEVKPWVQKAVDELWSLINDSNINWFADYTDENRATERNAMVFAWSTLLYIRKRRLNGLHKGEVFRLLRIYYLRSKNNVRAVTNILFEVDVQATSGIWKETTVVQEKAKNRLLETCPPDDLREIEYLIWQIEDHELNLNGRDVGMTNIDHLVDFEFEVTIEYLTKVKDKFYEIFPVDEKDNKYNKVKHVMLYYGEYYDQDSPYYYLNLKFNNWRRVIRGLGSFLKTDENPFLVFFNEFMSFDGSFDDFIKEKDKCQIKKDDVKDIRTRLLWYSQNLGSRMWSQGNSIAISHGNPCSLPDWNGKDKIFNESHILYNTKGNLKGGTPKELSTLLN